MKTINSKNKNNPETVNVGDVLNAPAIAVDMSSLQATLDALRAQFGDVLFAQAIPATVAKESINLHTAQNAREIEVLTARNKEIEAEIESLVSHLRAERAANVTRLAELGAGTRAKAPGERTRTETVCKGSKSLGGTLEEHTRHGKTFSACVFNPANVAPDVAPVAAPVAQ